MRFRSSLLKISAATLAAGVVACNDSNVNRSIPPIAGIVAGPDQTNGTGNVAMEVQTGSDQVVASSTITVTNLDHSGATGDAVVTGDPVQVIPVAGDVGDRLRVTLQHPTEGEISRTFVVPRPTISDVHAAGSGISGAVTLGHAAEIDGEGFCVTIGCDTITLRGPSPSGDPHDFAPTDPPRAGLLLFVLPTNGEIAPGHYSVRVSNGGTSGDQSDYVSDSFEISVTP